MRKAPLYLLSLALLLLMAGGQLLSPPRERSDMENRLLAQAPAFSWSALESGRFSEDFEAFAADQSPLRDPLIAVNALYNAAQGKALQNGVLLGRGDGCSTARTAGACATCASTPGPWKRWPGKRGCPYTCCFPPRRG